MTTTIENYKTHMDRQTELKMRYGVHNNKVLQKSNKKNTTRFFDAYHKLLNYDGMSQVIIHQSIKGEYKAENLLEFYQELANNESDDLFCYIEYQSIEIPMDVKRYKIILCDMNDTLDFRADVIKKLVNKRLGGTTFGIVLAKSYSKDYLTIMGTNGLKELLEPFKIKITERYFTHYGPHKNFYVMYIDVGDPIKTIGESGETFEN